jgi:hypothetical protein
MEKGTSDGTEGGVKATDDPPSETVAQHCYHLFDSHPRPQLDIHVSTTKKVTNTDKIQIRLVERATCSLWCGCRVDRAHTFTL